MRPANHPAARALPSRTAAGTPAWIGLGANLPSPHGPPAATLAWALARLDRDPGVALEAASPLVTTAPVGGPADQPPYANAVARVRTALAPGALLEALLVIEAEAGRVRRERWGPRSLDLDLLLLGRDGAVQVVLPGPPAVEVPHPRLHERRFVLEPLLALDPGLVHPVTGKTLKSHLAALPPAAAPTPAP